MSLANDLYHSYEALVEDSKALELLPEDKLHAFLEEPYEQVFLDAESGRRLNEREVIDLIK